MSAPSLGLPECSMTELAHVLQSTPELKFLAFDLGDSLRVEDLFELLTCSPIVPELQSLRIPFTIQR